MINIEDSIKFLNAINELSLDTLLSNEKTEKTINDIKDSINNENKAYIAGLLYHKLMNIVQGIIKDENINFIIENIISIYGSLNFNDKDIFILELRYKLIINRKNSIGKILLEKELVELLNNTSCNLQNIEKLYDLYKEIASYGIRLEMKQLTQTAIEKLNTLNKEINI